MISMRRAVLAFTILIPAISLGCASTGSGSGEKERSDLLTREQILGAEATNLYDVVRRLRPRWLNVRANRSFEMATEVVVIQNDVYMGPAEILKELNPETAFQLRYLEGTRAATALPGLMNDRHVEGAIVISTRPIG